MKYLQTIAITILLFALLALPFPVHAQEKVSGASAAATSFGELLDYEPDQRAIHLKRFLESYGSRLAGDAQTFVNEADKYGLDWKLVAAIAGTESTFGRHVPAGSYNAWGWGIPTGAQSGIGFDSWAHGIATVTQGLKKNYVDRGAITVEQMGRIYAASPRWAGNVRFFMGKIESYLPEDSRFLSLDI